MGDLVELTFKLPTVVVSRTGGVRRGLRTVTERVQCVVVYVLDDGQEVLVRMLEPQWLLGVELQGATRKLRLVMREQRAVVRRL